MHITPSVIAVFILINICTLRAQCDFNDQYSSNTGWTQVGTDVQVSNNQVEFLNGSNGSSGQKRIYKDLGTTLNQDDCWIAEFTFLPQSVGTFQGQPMTGHIPFALTAGIQEPFNDCPNLACTGYPIGVQDGIIVLFASNNPPTGELWLKIKLKDGSSEYSSQDQINISSLGTRLFLRLEKTTSGLELSVFMDAARTLHLTGSPIEYLNVPATINGLNTIQHATVVRGMFPRALTGSTDDLCINFNLGCKVDTLVDPVDSIVVNPIDTTIIVIEDSIKLEIPNIFSPNADGKNDLFIPIISQGITSMNTVIYNRWGKEVFATDLLMMEWDGHDVPDGTYYWIVNYVNKYNMSGSIKGTVSIIR